MGPNQVLEPGGDCWIKLSDGLSHWGVTFMDRFHRQSLCLIVSWLPVFGMRMISWQMFTRLWIYQTVWLAELRKSCRLSQLELLQVLNSYFTACIVFTCLTLNLWWDNNLYKKKPAKEKNKNKKQDCGALWWWKASAVLLFSHTSSEFSAVFYPEAAPFLIEEIVFRIK